MARKRSNAKPRIEGDDEFGYGSNVRPIHSRNLPQQKTFSVYDMKRVNPMTDNQQRAFDSYADGYNLSLIGSAGTGKTFIALYNALMEVLDDESEYDQLIIVRSAVASREVGHLPGTLEEKTEIYELPYKQVFDELFKRTNQYKHMKDAGVLEFHTTSFIRGLTFSNAIVIFDEAQNASYEELSTVITRLGKNSKLIVCGDTKQDDLHFKKNDVSGLPKFIQVLNKMSCFRSVSFTLEDVVRGSIVKEFLMAEEFVEKAYS